MIFESGGVLKVSFRFVERICYVNGMAGMKPAPTEIVVLGFHALAIVF